MGFNITQMRNELRVHLGNLSTTALSNTDADLLINRSWWQVQNSLGFEELKSSRSFNTVAGTKEYAIVPSVDEESIRALAYQSEDLKYNPILPWDLHEFLAELSDNENLRGAPEKYIREGDNIILWPIPDDIYAVTLYYLATLADWSDANPNISIPQSAHEIVLYGAIWRGYDRLGNLGRSSDFLTRQQQMITVFVQPQAKEQSEQPYVRVIPLRSKYP